LPTCPKFLVAAKLWIFSLKVAVGAAKARDSTTVVKLKDEELGFVS